MASTDRGRSNDWGRNDVSQDTDVLLQCYQISSQGISGTVTVKTARSTEESAGWTALGSNSF